MRRGCHIDSTTVMRSHHSAATIAPDPHLVPPILIAWLLVFRPCFTAPVWNRIVVLVAGAVLAPRKRTVTQVLRVMGLADEPSFRRYHEVLSRARWDGRAVAQRLLFHIIERLLPDGEVVIGIDDTIERRWGPRIKARGIYRDPVRSSKGHFVKTSGLRWLSLMVAVPIPWAGRTWALPFLTILAPSVRWSEANGKRHKTLTAWARQAILQTRRWLPNRRLVFVADSGFAALELLAAVRSRCCMITRLRLDANLFHPAPKRRKGQRGRPPLKGRALPKLSVVLKNKKTVWTRVVVSQWYDAQQRRLLVATGTALWYHAGADPLGTGPRPSRRTCAGRVSQHRHQRTASRHPRLVRLPLARGDHVPGSACPSRRGDAAAVVGPGDPAHHPGVAGIVLADYRVGRWPGPREHERATAKRRVVVPKAGTNVQRCHRRRPPRAVGAAEFIHVPAIW